MSDTVFTNPEDDLKDMEFLIYLKKTAVGLCRTNKIDHEKFLLLIELFKFIPTIFPWDYPDTNLATRLWKKIILFLDENLGDNFEEDFKILDYRENSFYNTLNDEDSLHDVILFLFLNLSKQNELLLEMLSSLIGELNLRNREALKIFNSLCLLQKEDKMKVVDFIETLREEKFRKLDSR